MSSTKRRVQSINPKDPNALQKVIEALEVSEGVRGNADDRKPTVAEVRQMISGGGVSVSAAGGGSSGGVSGTSSIPDRPSGLAAIIKLDCVVIRWNKPTYAGHGKSEVWRSATALLADAAFIGMTAANQFADFEAGSEVEHTYFVRHQFDVSLGSGTGPFSSGLAATSAEAEPLPSQVLIDANQYTDDQIAALNIIADAPSDGQMYVRMNGAWVVLPSS